MLGRIGDVLPRFRIFEALFLSHERLIQALSQAYLSILTFTVEAKDIFRRGKTTFMKILWKSFDKRFDQHIVELRGQCKAVEKEAGLSHFIESANARAEARKGQELMSKRRYESQRERFISSLSTIDPWEKHQTNQSLRYPETGDWFLHDKTYREWRRSKTSGCLCCNGIPGCGKTILMSRVIDGIREGHESSNINILFYYCDYSQPQSTVSGQVYGTFLKQAILQGLLPYEREHELVEKYSALSSRMYEKEILDILYSIFATLKPTLIILDGIDECDGDTRGSLTEFIKRCSNLRAESIKILFTCRDEDPILHGQVPCERIHLESGNLAADMNRFISNSVKERIERGELTACDQRLESDIAATLLAKAQGMFLWVYFQLNDLCDASSEFQIRQTLQNLPDGLNETYKRILLKITRSSNSSKIAAKVLRWIACARRPLHTSELQEAVAFDATDKVWDASKIPSADMIVRACCGFVVRDNKTQKVRFAHHSVLQYFTAAETFDHIQAACSTSIADQFCFSIDRAETVLRDLCFSYLFFSDFETTLTEALPQPVMNSQSVFGKAGPSALPKALGLHGNLFSLPYRFFGGHTDVSYLNIDLNSYLKARQSTVKPPRKLSDKYALLDYFVKFWLCYADVVPRNSILEAKIQDLILHKNLGFEHRPWGQNQHFGPHGCRGCPPPSDLPDNLELSAKKLPYVSLLHWAAENKQYNVTQDIDFGPYGYHERYHNETLLIACRHGNQTLVDQIFAQSTLKIDLSDGKAVKEACVSDDSQFLDFLLSLNATLSRAKFDINKNSYKILSWACTKGKLTVVETFTNHGASPNILDENIDQPLLHVAIAANQDKVVELLLQRGAFLNISNATGEFPLHSAIGGGQLDIVRSLMMYGATIFVQNSQGISALQLAFQKGLAEVIEILLDYGTSSIPDDVSLDNLTGQLMLQIAIETGRLNVMKRLLMQGAPVYLKNSSGKSTFHLAVENSQLEVVESFIQHASPSRIPDDDLGQSPLHLAAGSGHEQIMQLLIVCSSDFPNYWCFGLNARDISKETPLIKASKNGHTAIVEMLIDAGADPWLVSESSIALPPLPSYLDRLIIRPPLDEQDGKQLAIGHLTAAAFAAAYGHYDTFQVLLDYRATAGFSKRQLNDLVPILNLAAAFGRGKVITMIRDKGFFTFDRSQVVTLKAEQGLTPLHLAVYYEHHNIVLLLLEWAPYMVDMRTRVLNWTATMSAACIGRVDILKSLVNAGASLEATDRYIGMQAIHFAAVNENADAVQFFLDRGADVENPHPLYCAAELGLLPFVKAIVALGTRHRPGDSARSPLELAALNHHLECFEPLFEESLKNRPWDTAKEIEAALREGFEPDTQGHQALKELYDKIPPIYRHME